jgi:hypothetical protein
MVTVHNGKYEYLSQLFARRVTVKKVMNILIPQKAGYFSLLHRVRQFVCFDVDFWLLSQ